MMLAIAIMGVALAGATSPYLCRLLAAALLAWSDAVEAWRRELAAAWARRHDQVVGTPARLIVDNGVPVEVSR